MKTSFWDVLAVLALLGVVLFAVIFLAIFINPYSLINPLKPPALPTLFKLGTITDTATSTSTPFVFPATWTPAATSLLSTNEATLPGAHNTSTLIPTHTLFVLPSFTPSYTPSNTPTATRTSTLTPTITNTPTITKVPTYTPLPTYTQPATLTSTQVPTDTSTAAATP